MADVQAQQQAQPNPEEPQADGAEHAGAEVADAEEQGDQPAVMTKSQLKKLKKRQFYEERKLKRKGEERQKKQEEQARRREEGRKRMDSMTEEEQEKWREERNARGVARKQERQADKERMEKALASGQKVVVDLDFAHLMLEGEQKSICGQLSYCWHANCGAAQPVHLVMSSVRGKMKEVLDKQVAGYVNWKATATPLPYIEHFADQKEQLVYLTADSENELQELDSESIYIIGGIVDRNRHKLLCFNKANEQGIKHARLPIGDYMKLASSQVMTTNHVMSIMLRWMELRDWKKAFEAVIPNRKRKHGEGSEEQDQDEQEEMGEQQQQQQEGVKEAAQEAAAAGQESGAEEPQAERQQAEGAAQAASEGHQEEQQEKQAVVAAAAEGQAA